MSSTETQTAKWPESWLIDPEVATKTCLLVEIVSRFGTSFNDELEKDSFFRESPADNISKAYEHAQCGICGAAANMTHDGLRIVEIAKLENVDVPSLLVCMKTPNEDLV
jgi:hypothetical protein